LVPAGLQGHVELRAAADDRTIRPGDPLGRRDQGHLLGRGGEDLAGRPQARLASSMTTSRPVRWIDAASPSQSNG
jgi:hypothetical protein